MSEAKTVNIDGVELPADAVELRTDEQGREFAVIEARKVTSDQFHALIMIEVRRQQQRRNK